MRDNVLDRRAGRSKYGSEEIFQAGPVELPVVAPDSRRRNALVLTLQELAR